MSPLEYVRPIAIQCLLLAVLASCTSRCALAQTPASPDPAGAADAQPDFSLGNPSDLPPAAPMPGMEFETEAPGIPLYEQYVRYNSWRLQLLPEGLIYRSYLAGPKESRMAAGMVSVPEDSTMWDATIGGRFGLLRWGNSDPFRPQGFELQAEASAQIRLDIPEDVDVRSADFRVGFPLAWGNEYRQWKFGYYHMSSHLVDEFLEKNPEFPMFRQARDALVFGHSVYLTDSLRIYGEAAWAFYCNASDPWEFQFGIDYAPRRATGWRGAPFFAINGMLREELDFGGGLNTQLGWAWRADTTAHLLRIGFQYYNGAIPHYAFLPYHEQQFGLWAWYDF